MHADFIEQDHYCDYSACIVNQQPKRDKAKYEYNGYKKQFNVWFIDMDLNNVLCGY